jgi:hypothetical protein
MQELAHLNLKLEDVKVQRNNKMLTTELATKRVAENKEILGNNVDHEPTILNTSDYTLASFTLFFLLETVVMMVLTN